MEKILGFNVTTLNKNEIITLLQKDLINKKQNIIYNINPLILTNFYNNSRVKNAFNKEKYSIPDGYGIVLASKINHGIIKETIPGIELMEDICAMSVLTNKTIYFYGSKEGIAKKAKKELEKKYPKIKIIGTLNGYVNETEAISEIKKVQPDILFIAMGSPKQEMFIIDNQDQLKNIGIIMPVGGSLDVISNDKKRAPKFYTRFHLEWFYRMVKEPKRIKTNLKLIKFINLVIFKNKKYNK